MAVEDLVPVLQGIAGAYGKVSAARGNTTQHKLRLVAIRPGSAKLILDVWQMVNDNSGQIQAVSNLVEASMAVMAVIVSVIALKKHTKGEPYSTKIDGQNGLINIVNSQHVSLAVSLQDFNIFKERLIDQDLSRVVRPLEAGRIDESKVSVSAPGFPPLSEKITASEKGLFDTGEASVTKTAETWITGQINSMTKSTNSGHIYLNDGSRVYFKLKTDSPGAYYNLFGHNGPVKVRCIAHMDESFRPTSLDVFEIIPLQSTFPFSDSGE
jgi:hypothetical protein